MRRLTRSRFGYLGAWNRRRPSRSKAARLRRRMSPDEGTTLIELMVGMILMVVFMAMFTGAIVMMNSAMNKSQAVNLTSSQLNVAFLSLDDTVRYASFISTPGKGKSGDWYVELRSTNRGTEICSQLRVNTAAQQLQRRSWTVLNTIASTPSAWVPIASGITARAADGGLTQPFALVPLRANASSQQLTVTLVAPSGSGSSLTNSTSSCTFTALNSVVPVPTEPYLPATGAAMTSFRTLSQRAWRGPPAG